MRRRSREETAWRRKGRRSSSSSRSCWTRRRSRRRTGFADAGGRLRRRDLRARRRDYEAFWAEHAEALHWDTKWDQVLDWSNPPFAKWFVGGKLNVSYNCVDRHVEAGNGDRVAYHWRGEEGEELDVTYADLHRDVQKFANALKDLGVEQGRRRRRSTCR